MLRVLVAFRATTAVKRGSAGLLQVLALLILGQSAQAASFFAGAEVFGPNSGFGVVCQPPATGGACISTGRLEALSASASNSFETRVDGPPEATFYPVSATASADLRSLSLSVSALGGGPGIYAPLPGPVGERVVNTSRSGAAAELRETYTVRPPSIPYSGIRYALTIEMEGSVSSLESLGRFSNRLQARVTLVNASGVTQVDQRVMDLVDLFPAGLTSFTTREVVLSGGSVVESAAPWESTAILDLFLNTAVEAGDLLPGSGIPPETLHSFSARASIEFFADLFAPGGGSSALVARSSDLAPIPEPGTLALLSVGVVAFLTMARRKPARAGPRAGT